MKQLIFCIFLLCSHLCSAQNANDLNYPEIDSLLKYYSKQKQHEEGIKLAIQASSKSGTQDSLCGEYLEWTARLYQNSTQHDKAKEYYEKAVLVFEKALGKKTARYASTLIELGLFYKLDIGNYQLALPLIEEAVDIHKKIFGPEHLEYAKAIDNLGSLHGEMGNAQIALPMLKEAMAIREKEVGKEHYLYAESLNNMASIFTDMGDYDKALACYTKTKEIFATVYGKEHSDYATVLNNLGSLYYGLGDYKKALPLFKETTIVLEKVLGKEHPNFAASLNNLAVLNFIMGNYDEALPLYIRAKDIRAKVLGKEHPDYASSLNNIGYLYQVLGDYDKALPIYIQALDIRKKVLGEAHPLYATSLNNLAILEADAGNLDRALKLYIEAKDIREKAFGKEHSMYAQAISNLAGIYEEMNNHSAALPLFIEAKDIELKALGKETPSYAGALHSLAYCYLNMGEYEAALPLFIESKEIRGRTLGKKHPDYPTALKNLALTYYNMRNYEKSWETVYQALNHASSTQLNHTLDNKWADSLIAAPIPSNRHHEELIGSLNIAYLILKADGSKEAIEKQIKISDVATALLTKLRHKVSNESDKLRMLGHSYDWLNRNLYVLTPSKHSQKAFELSDQNKSALLLQSTKVEKAYQLGVLPDSLIQRDKQLLKTQNQFQAQLLEKRSKKEKDSLRNELIHVNQDIDALLKMIEKKYPKYHKLKYQHNDAKVEELQILLDDKTVLLEYVISDSILHIFKVAKNEVQWIPRVLNKKKLTDKIKELHDVLKNYSLLSKKAEESYTKYTALAFWFYQNTIEPIIKDHKDIENLIIVTDGQLGHLPFETFLIKQAPQQVTKYSELHYLVSDYNISYNYSATLWKENKEALSPKNNGQILGVAANYNIKLDSALMDVRLPTDQSLRVNLQPLPAARKEIQSLQEQYQGFFAFDTLASEKTVKEKATDYAILHFATHGILETKRPVLSSLAFSEDSDSIESNFWQAHEISKLELNANLVVLSACETGYGRFEKGNGIASLARAFMYAGASSLIVSLWQVNDFATSEIMKNLYANLANGMNKDKALRQTKLQYMIAAKGIAAHPAFWSPFIMIGNTEPVQIKRKGNSMTLEFALGFLALIGIVSFFLIKRNNKDTA